jgi:uncharacterized protein (DUF1810 family)
LSEGPPLARFVDAQAPIYAQALGELRAGRKTTHWIWYIFPQLAALGRSDTARYYGIADLAEARAYLAHPLLADRLSECAAAMLTWQGQRSARDILGEVDGIKLRSSMTLFEAAGGPDVFGATIEALYDGARDPRTLALLRG